MTCDYCKQQPKDDGSFSNDCVLFALENIKQHYLYLRNVISVKDIEIQKLQKRNEKLSKAVEMLQQDQLRSSLSLIRHESPPRRQEIRLRKSNDEKQPQVDVEDLTVDDLNMALNSEQIFNCSSTDTSTHLSPNQNESISETEKMNNSSRVLRIAFEKRRELFKKQNPSSPFKSPLKSNENISPVKTDQLGAVRKANTCWMSKEKELSANTFGATNVKKSISFVKPQAVNLSKVERKSSLSLKKPPKLRQTRLQLDVSRDKSFCGSDSTFCEEVIDSSPNPNANKRQEKPSRSWLLRVNSSVKNASSKAAECNNGEVELNLNNDEDDFGNIFDFSLRPATPPQKKSTNAHVEAHGSLNDLKQPKSPTVDSMEIKESDSNSSSVMILTPTTQEIIFLDDTCNDETQIESMDLLKDVLKNNDESLENLRRIESEKIKKLQKSASVAPRLETNAITKQQFSSKAELSKVNSFPGPTSTASPSDIIVKQEKKSQESKSFEATPKLLATKRKSKDISSDEEEEEGNENLMPKPFIVKQEKVDDVITKDVQDVHSKKLSIKEKFKIDCRECEQYIGFLGDRMTDKEIMEHLQRCTRHQRKDDFNSTPEGFWDPFIATLDANDPRNETLIDTRFCNKKK